MRCPTCGSTDIGAVAFEAANGATFRFCRWCERGWWEAHGEGVAVERILTAASAIRPARRRSRRS